MKTKETYRTYKINSTEAGCSSILLKISKQKYRALVDSGAEKSLISRRVYNSISDPPPLRHPNVSLESVTGGKVEIVGSIDLEFVVAGLRLHHEFYVCTNMGRNAILG